MARTSLTESTDLREAAMQYIRHTMAHPGVELTPQLAADALCCAEIQRLTGVRYPSEIRPSAADISYIMGAATASLKKYPIRPSGSEI
jgi:hypothetical protein